MERIVLVDHGSSLPDANRSVEQLAERLAIKLGKEVIAAHMELAPPLFQDLLDSLAIQPNLRRLVILPLFISGGKHHTEDILGPIERFSRAFPDIEVRILPPLAEQEGFVEYLCSLLEKESPP
jgi:sirohydrochlorin ferrochelatase